MQKNVKDQSGFGSLEAILILVIIVIIGFVGWFVYNSNNKANNTINTANQANNVAQPASVTSSKTAVAAGTRAKNIAVQLLAYNKTNPKSALSTYVDKHINDYEFTKAFKTSVDGGSALVLGTTNPVYCSTGSAPTNFKVADSSLSGDTASVTLSPTGTNAGTTDVQVSLNYVYNTWSVNEYACKS